MGDTLSQDEIDELFRSLASGDTDLVMAQQSEGKREAKNYDFATPAKFNKEHLRALEIVFDNYSRLVSSYLTGYLRTSVNIEVASAEQVKYSEFSNLLVNPVILSIVDLLPLKGSVVFEMASGIGYSIIDRILGGPGVGLKKLRDFTDLEKILLERVLVQIVSFLPEAWENIETIKPKFERIETNSQFAQIISPNEIIALVTLSIKVGSSEGLMNFCLPHLVLESIMDKLNTRLWFTNQALDVEEISTDIIEAKLEKTSVQVIVEVGKTIINVDDFIHLQVGDIIPLDSYVNSDLNILVGNLVKFKGKPGVSRGKNAIQVTSLIDKEES